jgi:hypothetical protein
VIESASDVPRPVRNDGVSAMRSLSGLVEG